MVKKEKFVCYGCGKDRPCFVECNQEPSFLVDRIEDLKCVLDGTNQTGYKWEYYSPTSTNTESVPSCLSCKHSLCTTVGKIDQVGCLDYRDGTHL